MDTTAKIDFFAYAGSGNERGKVIVALGGVHAAHTTRIVMSAESAADFAERIMHTVHKVPRDRVGTPADLGCEVL